MQPTIQDLLKKHQASFAPIMPYSPSGRDISWLDLSKDNERLMKINFESTEVISAFIEEMMEEKAVQYIWGGYNEHRVWYQRSELFGSDRCIHLGIDIWGETHSPIFAPLEGKVHSFQDNMGYGNYGPTIILEHILEGQTFYTLYGHLSRASLGSLEIGQTVSKGEKFAELGDDEENGNWAPHVHFQLMTDMQGNMGDYPGVCSITERDAFLEICLDPNLILGL